MSNPSRWDPSRTGPEGHAALGLFQLAPGHLHLNHGSYGALPTAVSAEQDRWRARIESNATGFFADVLPGELRRQAAVAAQCFGGAPQDWVFCENATSAVNAVLASMGLRDNDEIVTTSHAYGAVLKAMRIWASRFGARVAVADIPAIVRGEDEIISAIEKVLTARTRLLVVDHITSPTAIVFPVQRIVRIARERGVAVLVDGAHAPGQVLLDVETIGADWYTGNAHKWLFAPKGCGLLWTAPHWQERTRPTVLSHGAPDGYTQAFDWIGTRDVTPWLCFETAAGRHAAFGGKGLIARNRALAAEGASLVCAVLGAAPSAPESLRAAMASVALGPAPADLSEVNSLRRTLWEGANIVVPVFTFGDRLWIRISSQIYNELGDYTRLADRMAAPPAPAETR